MKTESESIKLEQNGEELEDYEKEVILLDQELHDKEDTTEKRFIVFMGLLLAIVGAVIFGLLSPITLVGVEVYWWNPIIGGFFGALLGAIIGIILDSFLNASGAFRKEESV